MSIAAPVSKSVDEHPLRVEGFGFAFGDDPALEAVDLAFPRERVTAIIGPSGCGKTTLLRALNRLNDLMPGARHTSGQIWLGDKPLYHPQTDVASVRRRVGMLFQQSNPFPFSIYENIAYGLRILGQKQKAAVDEKVRESLEAVALWDDLKDRLHEVATALTPGQQQRLCLARALAVEPEVLLMDEPCALLDPVATAKVEELLHFLKKRYTIVIVTHNLQQAARVSDLTAFFYQGRLVEVGETEDIFVNPRIAQTEAYISGRFG